MQDLSYSTESFSPSFSFYVSGDGEVVEAAVRVVRESQSYGDEFEFETSPLREESFFHFPTETKSFKREEEEEDVDVAADRATSKSLFYGGWILDQSLSSPSQSHSSSESEDSEDLSPRRYNCFWSPLRSPARADSSKSKTSRRCRITDLLRRSHSEGSVSTTTSEPKRCRFKDLLKRSHSDSDGRGGESSVSTSGNSSPAVSGKYKTTSNKYTASTGEVNMRRKTYLPYRQDLIGVFAGMSRLRR